jgi:AraC family transcriptional activator of pobA
MPRPARFADPSTATPLAQVARRRPARHQAAAPGQPRTPAQLPAFALYGEADRSPVADALHCESIAARSGLHGWEIRPHRHAALAQLLWVKRGQVWAQMDGRSQHLQGPALLTVPPLAAHGFRFSPDVDGHVFTVQQRHLQALLQPFPGLAAVLAPLRGWALDEAAHAAHTTELQAAALALRDELQGQARWRQAALDGALLRLLVAVARAAPVGVADLPGPGAGPGAEPNAASPARPQAAPPAERALAHVHRLQALVEQRFREQPTVQALAQAVGITATQLNRVCRQVLGCSALAVLHARLLLEAQRELAYTTMPIKQVALDLGFADAAYFSRFFQRAVGVGPAAWRQGQGAT